MRFVCFTIVLYLSSAHILTGSSSAHHSAAGDLGQSTSTQAPVQNAQGNISNANHRISLEQTLFRISEQPTFIDPIAEDSLWWWTSLTGTFALRRDFELGLSIPVASRFPLEQGSDQQTAFGDIRFNLRYFVLEGKHQNYNLSASTQVSLPTGAKADGFSARNVVQHASLAMRAMLGQSDVIVGADTGAAWSYESSPQLATDYRVLLSSPELARLRLTASLWGLYFFFDSTSSLQSIPSQRREEGDFLLTFSPALNLSITQNLLIIATSDLPLSSKRNYDWACSLSLQYWFSSTHAP